MERLKPCPFCGNTDITGATHKPTEVQMRGYQL